MDEGNNIIKNNENFYPTYPSTLTYDGIKFNLIEISWSLYQYMLLYKILRTLWIIFYTPIGTFFLTYYSKMETERTINDIFKNLSKSTLAEVST